MAKTSKPDFSAAAAGSKDIFAAIANGGPGSNNGTSASSGASGNSASDETTGNNGTSAHLYRFTLRLNDDQRTYLQQAAFERSAPGHICSVTEYLIDLIEADKLKHQIEADKRQKGSIE